MAEITFKIRNLLIFPSILVFLLAFSNDTLGNNLEKMAVGKSDLIEFSQDSQLFLQLANYDIFFRRSFGIKSRPKSERVTRSETHPSSRPQPYTPPPSGSRNPEQQGTTGNLPSSDISAVSNIPKPPLFKSRKNQFQSMGLWEMGVSLATTHALTDIASSKGLSARNFASHHTSSFGIGGGLYGRYLMNHWFSVKFGINFVQLSHTREEPIQIAGRNILSFNNDLFEFFGKTEFSLPLLAESPWDLYAYMGIGAFLSDASIFDQNERLITFGDDYSQVQPFIPMGFGFSVKVTNSLKIGYEMGWRNTIFHYLDGVKADDRYDNYFLNSVKIGFLF